MIGDGHLLRKGDRYKEKERKGRFGENNARGVGLYIRLVTI